MFFVTIPVVSEIFAILVSEIFTLALLVEISPLKSQTDRYNKKVCSRFRLGLGIGALFVGIQLL